MNDEEIEEGMFSIPNTPLEKAKIVFIPVPWEGTATYGKGTREAPEAILGASGQLDWYDLDVKDVHSLGFHYLDNEITNELKQYIQNYCTTNKHYFKIGDVEVFLQGKELIKAINKAGLKIIEYTYTQTMSCLRQGQIPAIIGGEHSVSFGAIEAASRKYPIFDILHIDAHMDMREAYEGHVWSHASVMYNVASRIPNVHNIVQVGIRDFCEEELEFTRLLNSASGIQRPKISQGNVLDALGKMYTKVWTHYDQELARKKFQGRTWLKLCDGILGPLREHVWVTIDIDGLNPSWCPNTGTPVPGGLEYNELVFLLKRLAKSGRKIIGFDLVEVAPGKKNEWDANVAMRLLYKLSGLAAASQGILEWAISPKI